MNCRYCGKFSPIKTGAYKNHEYRCRLNPSRILINGNRGKSTWSKGLTKYTDERIAFQAQQLVGVSTEGRISKEKREKLSFLAKQRNLGGYRPHPNKGQTYKNLWFDSKWEVRVAQSLDFHNIKWEKPKTGFVWNEFGNKYYPDFFLPDFNVFLDPKNSYLREKDRQKIENAQRMNDIRVIVLSETQLDWKEIYAAIIQ